MKLKAFGDSRVEKLKSFTGKSYAKSPKSKLRIIGVTTAVLLWTFVVQLTAIGDAWGPMVLKGWASHSSLSATDYDVKLLPIVPARVLPRVSYLLLLLLETCCHIITNWHLPNLVILMIYDMVAIARYLNVSLIVPELDKSSFWADPRELGIGIVPWTKLVIGALLYHSISNIKLTCLNSFQLGLKKESNLESYTPCLQLVSQIFHTTITRYKVILQKNFFNCLFTKFKRFILPLIQRYKNDGQPFDLQKLRCRVNFSALKFTSQIENLVLQLIYEIHMLAFSGCTQGCNDDEIKELTRMRFDFLTTHLYAYPWWKEKDYRL
ncbi:hypothetical protein LXL04_034124 [Taraxacum kok-saghyz]